jgi:hypothetical protein
MRVPTYKSQSKTTAKTGAINFSIQASPSALSAGSRAMSDLGDLGMKVSLDYLEKQMKMERTADINARENRIRSKALSLITDAQKTNFKNTTEATSYFNRKWLPISLEATKGISDNKVRASITEKLNDLKLISQNDFNKISRIKIIDYGKAQSLEKEKTLIDKISTSSGTALVEAQNELYGPNGLYASMVSDGLITNEAAQKRVISTKNKTAILTINKELSAAAYSSDYSSVERVANDLFNPNKYKDLNEDSRVIMQKKANGLALRLEKAVARRTEKQTKINDKLIKKTQRSTYSKFLLKLNKEDPVTLDKLDTLFADNKLDKTQYDTLRTRLIEGDEVASDQGTVLEFKNEIYDAQNRFEIDQIVDKYGKRIGLGNPISIKDFNSLKDFAEDQKANTPRAKEIKRFRGLIKNNIGAMGGISSGNNSVRDRLLGADALDTFDRLIEDKDINGNIRLPRDVYDEVIEQIRDTQNSQTFLSFNTKTRNLLGDFNFRDLDENAVKDRLNILKQQILEDTTSGFSQTEKAIEFETIKLFQQNYKLLRKR